MAIIPIVVYSCFVLFLAVISWDLTGGDIDKY